MSSRSPRAPNLSPPLSRTLGPWMLWGLGVGYVISGMYFGWNLGLAEGGTGGMAVATAVVILLYISFTFSYAELACAIPKAGGVFDYATRGLNRDFGFIAGAAQLIEFLFAPPAIAAAIGAYFHLLFLPQVPVTIIAVAAYLFFTALNIYGVKAAAGFELAVTLLAVFELPLFFRRHVPAFFPEEPAALRGRTGGREPGRRCLSPSGSFSGSKGWRMWRRRR